MTPEQVASVEKKLEEAKSKAKLINQRAEESRKDLEKVVTTAIKQESEKVCDVKLYIHVCMKIWHSIVACSYIHHPSVINSYIIHTTIHPSSIHHQFIYPSNHHQYIHHPYNHPASIHPYIIHPFIHPSIHTSYIHHTYIYLHFSILTIARPEALQ